MNIEKQLQIIFTEAFSAAGYELDGDVHIEKPKFAEHGDFSCTSALAYAKKNGMNPHDVAQKVIDVCDRKMFELVSVDGPGFINVTLKKEVWSEFLNSFDSQKVEATQLLAGKTILLEHSSLNLFKPFSIGHVVNNSLGVALRNIMRFAGSEVTEVSFPSDVSPGVAKGVWAVIKNDWQNKMDINTIGEAYRLGVVAYKEDEVAKTEIDQINKELYGQTEGEALEVYKKAREVSMEYFEAILSRLDTHHDTHLFESLAAPVGTKLVTENTPDIFTESDGAVIFEGSKHGLFDNVFVNSAGFATYLAKDLGLIQLKLEKYPDSDSYITIADVEQKQHFELVKKAAEFVFPQEIEKIEYVQHGRLSLPTGRISSRDGGVPMAEELLATLNEETKKKSIEAGKEISDKDAESIALGAMRFALLRASASKNVVFDVDSSLSFEGDSGPYIQYTHVRAQSVLNKVDNQKGNGGESQTEFMNDVPEVVHILERFNESVANAVEFYAPHHIAQYLLELAQSFNSFYGNTKILDESNADYVANIMIVSKVAQTLETGLSMLGMQTVEKM